MTTRRRLFISLAPDLYDAVKVRWKALEYPSFSAYLDFLIWQDLRERPKHVRIREELADDDKAEIKQKALELMRPKQKTKRAVKQRTP